MFSFQTGGAENMLIDIINEQVLHAEISLYIVNNNVDQKLLQKLDSRAIVKQIKRTPGSKNPIPLLLLNIFLLMGKYKVIHCHNHNMISLLVQILYKRTILTVHDTKIESPYFKRYKQCYSISKAVHDDIIKRKNIFTKVINNGIDFKSIISSVDNSIRNNPFNILQISRLHHKKKGQHIAIEAVKLLTNKGYNIHLYFIGEGNSEGFLKEMCDEREINDRIFFLGLKERAFIYENLHKYDLLIQPSFNEGFGLTIVEAIAAKVPVLVSAIEGPLEIIQNGRYGYFFETGNALDLADKILEVVNADSCQIKEITEKAFSYAMKKYDIRNTALSYLKEYTSI